MVVYQEVESFSVQDAKQMSTQTPFTQTMKQKRLDELPVIDELIISELTLNPSVAPPPPSPPPPPPPSTTTQQYNENIKDLIDFLDGPDAQHYLEPKPQSKQPLPQPPQPSPYPEPTAPSIHPQPSPYPEPTAPSKHPQPSPYPEPTAPSIHPQPSPYPEPTAPSKHPQQSPYPEPTAPSKHPQPSPYPEPTTPSKHPQPSPYPEPTAPSKHPQPSPYPEPTTPSKHPQPLPPLQPVGFQSPVGQADWSPSQPNQEHQPQQQTIPVIGWTQSLPGSGSIESADELFHHTHSSHASESVPMGWVVGRPQYSEEQ
ncbi:hypothetical protein Pmani_013089 [Petrolisthes manimaculis]|uniref:Uncharacterized protein n=1 Tax=Petrolisthes manimaculis TaxID=1843537 RepID=A0AAE1PVQ3_9EUCA|nr:hypothetical protein Pmani_013089 [Petrolisthes manimaculis]